MEEAVGQIFDFLMGFISFLIKNALVSTLGVAMIVTWLYKVVTDVREGWQSGPTNSLVIALDDIIAVLLFVWASNGTIAAWLAIVVYFIWTRVYIGDEITQNWRTWLDKIRDDITAFGLLGLAAVLLTDALTDTTLGHSFLQLFDLIKAQSGNGMFGR